MMIANKYDYDEYDGDNNDKYDEDSDCHVDIVLLMIPLHGADYCC